MITIDFENFDDIELLNKLAKENGLTIVKDEVMNFDAAEVMSIIGNSAQIIALLITLYQMFGKNKHVNYHSNKYDQENINLAAAAELAQDDE